MELTEKQKRGLEIIQQRYKNKERYTVIAGYAGSGKTTLIRIAIQALGLKEDEVGYAAPTGKAALVMKNMGNDEAITIHRLLYDWRPTTNGKFIKMRKDWLPYKVVVVDEVSMIKQEFIDELARHKETHCIFLGDPFQLPCIDPDANHLLDNPHVFLDEVMRQADGNDIVDMTLSVREMRGLPEQDGKNYKFLTQDTVTTGLYGWADQVITATNADRQTLNKYISAYHGFTPGLVEEGQRIVCNRNYWDICSTNGQPLVNGMIGTILNLHEEKIPIMRFLFPSVPFITQVVADFKVDNDLFTGLRFDKQQLITGTPTISGFEASKIDHYYNGEYAQSHGYINPIGINAELGWAITCHKAQGSQYNKVAVYENAFPHQREEHARWVYTAATRAIDKLVMVRL